MKRRIVKLTVLAVGVLMTGAFAFAGEIGKVTAIEGKVDILQPGQSEARPAGEGAVISVGDAIRTKSASKAEITFADNTVVKLAEKTRVEIKDYQLDAQGKRITAVLNIERGKIRAVVSKSAAKDNFIINTPNASGSVKGTDLYVIYQKSSTGVVVLDGKVSVANSSLPDKSIEIASGDTTVISSDQPPTATRAILAMEKKSHEADTQIAKAREEKPLSAEGYSSPEGMTAVVVKVSGGAQIRSRGALTWHDAKINEVLNAGDVIDTKDDGKIEIKLENGNVINLKPDSELKLQKLSKDLKTGDYENLLESSHGKIRAQVQKLKGNSKFEIKTPTAVAAVRGTILFLNILPNMTTAYFENGNGTVQNVVSGVIQTVVAGSSSSADDQGNVSPPAPPSDEQQSEWQEGWESEGGGEGYSAPGGDTGGEDTGEDTGGDTITGGGDTTVFDDKPVTDDNPPDTDTGGTTTGGTTPETYFNAELTLGTTLAEWSEWPTGQDTALTGTYSDPDNLKLLWNDITGTDADGGTYKGWVSGSWHSWEGAFAFIYIDSTGQAGYFGNFIDYLSGTYTGEGAGTVTGNGELFVIPYADLEPGVAYPIEVGGGSGDLNLSLVDGGALNTTFDREMKRIEGESWGIWKEIYSGTYNTPEGLTLGDDGRAYWGGITGGRYKVDGYSFTAIVGSDDLNSSLIMGLARTYLDYDTYGVNYGTILGDYDGEGNLQAIGLGGFVEEPLTFSGRWGEEETSLYYNNEGYIQWAGEDYGLVGSTVSNWWNENVDGFPFLAMGEYRDDDGYSDRYLWNTPIQSYNAEEGNSTTLDGGAFYGYTTGIWNNETMDGAVAALYIDPDGNAGLLRGDVSGKYYPGIEMWMADGTLTPTFMSMGSELNPANLYLGEGGYIHQGGIDDFDTARLYGEFGDSQGYIYGWMYSGNTYAIGEDADWGIYDIKLGNGNYFNNPNPQTYTTWSGVMGGPDEDDAYWLVDLTSGTWQNDEIRADVNGTFLSDENLGTIEGDLFGVNNGGGTWIGTVIGSYTEEPLAWSAGIDADYHYGYDDGDGVYVDYYDSHYGLIGATESPFPTAGTKTVDISLMGETYPEGYITWWGSLSGSYADESEIPDGFIAGRTNSIEGMLVSLYVDTLGNAGTLEGTFDGNYYPEIDMWQAEGSMTATKRTTDYNPVSYDSDGNYIDGYLHGDFNGSGEIYNDYSIYEASNDYGYGYLGSYTTWLVKNNNPEPWGIYNIELGGYYDDSTPNNWTLNLGGDQWRGIEDEYWLATITGSQWSEQRIAGELTGQYLTSTALGTILGNVLGSFDTDDEGIWEAIALGTFTEEPLTFSGYWGGGDDSLYNNSGNGNFEWVGEEYGLIGSTALNWWEAESFPILAMGDYYVDYNGEEPYIWNTQINSYNTNEGNSTTLDGGAFYGFTAGIWNNQVMDGVIAALYIAPTGIPGVFNAGYLRGDLDGKYYPDLGYDDYYDYGMWQAEGTLTPMEMAQNISISPEELEWYFYNYSDEIANRGLYGDFGEDFSFGESDIYGGQYSGYTYRIGEDANWGIFNIKLGDGNYYNGSPATWSAAMGGDYWRGSGDTEYWLAKIEEGTWENDEIRAEVNGRYISDTYLGTIEGDFFGVNRITGTWIGTTVGVWYEEPLTFSGRWGNDDPNLYYNNEQVGFVKGLMGSTQEAWWTGPFDFVAMGDYEADYDGEAPYIWLSPIRSYNAELENDKTLDGGAYFGFSAGIWKDGQMKNGKTVALYLSPAENNNRYDGGILSGGASGNYYAFPEGFVEPGDTEVGLFVVDGTLVPEEYLENRWVAADKFDDITSIIVQRNMYLGIMDELDFTYAEGSTYNISGQPGWGIWQANMMGSTSEEMASDWRVALGGKVLNSNGSSYAYWLGTIEGSRWEDAELEGLYRGVSFRLLNIDGNRMINASRVTADVVGTYDVPTTYEDGQLIEVDTTWQAAAVGEWVDLAVLDFGTNAENLLFRDALAAMVEVPITEIYTALLTDVTGNANITAGSIDLSVYNNEIFTGIVNMTWLNLPVIGDMAGISSGSDNLGLTFTNIDTQAMTWAADVAGQINDLQANGAGGGPIIDNGSSYDLNGLVAGTLGQVD